jgi:hypothetical protein
MRRSSEVKPSEKFSRSPHCSSPPHIRLSTEWFSRFTMAYWPVANADGAWAALLSMSSIE